MNPEADFDAFQVRESGLMTRRALLREGALGMVGLAATAPSGASGAISALMCPPKAGSFAGSAGTTGGGGWVESNTDYSGSVPDDGPGMRRLVMTNGRTGERYDMEFVRDGKYVPEAIEAFSKFARDWRQNEVKAFDPKVIDIVWKIWRKLGTETPMNLNSGYRSPKTNGSLPGAAKQSQHMHARATDLSHPSIPASEIHKAAMSDWVGGVGRYDTFCHVDSGAKRRWG